MKKPSVTQLTGLLDKPALMKWANKIGLEGIRLDEYRKKVTTAGTSLHKQIEDFLLLRKPFEDMEIQRRCEDFFFDKIIHNVEKVIETDYFQGRMDIKFRFKGVDYIADFKSNQSGVYLENKLQLSAYRMSEGSDKVCIISIPDFTLIEVAIEDFSPYESIMIKLSEIHELKNTIENQ